MNSLDHPHTILDVRRLSVSVMSGSRTVEIVHDITFDVGQGETVVLLGESGSGKTILSRALTNLFPVTVPVKLEGSVMFEGRAVFSLDRKELALIRRRKIRYVFQEPMQSLNPVAKIRAQIQFAAEGMHENSKRVTEALEQAGLENVGEILDSYPHQLSVGMAQRVCIAMATLPSPTLLIADEPTSAVDASLRYKLLDLLFDLQHSGTRSMVLITHDLTIARSYGDRVIIMYDGRVIEAASRKDFFQEPLHPYSRLLLESIPAAGKPVVQESIKMVETKTKIGCRFHPRCPIAQDKCRSVEPDLELTPEGREVRCFYWK